MSDVQEVPAVVADSAQGAEVAPAEAPAAPAAEAAVAEPVVEATKEKRAEEPNGAVEVEAAGNGAVEMGDASVEGKTAGGAGESMETTPESTPEVASATIPETTPEASSTAVPEASSTTAPDSFCQSVSETSPQVSNTASVPEASTGALPEASTAAVPEASASAISESSTGALLEVSSASAVPKASTDAVPEAATSTVSEASANAFLESSADAAPEVDPEVLLAQGRREQLCGETQKAVGLFQEACRLLFLQYSLLPCLRSAAKHGETGAECGEAYYLYGSALLDLSRMESGVLGNALQGIATAEPGDEEEKETEEDKQFTEPDSFTAEEKEKISEDVLDAMLEEDKNKKQAEDDTVATTTVAEPSPADADKAETATEKCEESAAVDQADEEEKEGEKDKDEEEEEDGEADEEASMEEDTEENVAAAEEEDEVSNLQLAWEMLELAKNIYKKQDCVEMRLKQADCLLKLGEVGLESEQHAQAVEDLLACLALQTAAGLDLATDRRLALTHYQLGLAHAAGGQWAAATASHRTAAGVIAARVRVLEGEGEAAGEVEGELRELRGLLPEILNKIEDAEEDGRNAVRVKAMIHDLAADDTKSCDIAVAGGVTSSGFSESTLGDAAMNVKPVTNVTHLVRRKRKPEEEGEEEEQGVEVGVPKKQRTSDAEPLTPTDTNEASATVRDKLTKELTNGELMNGEQNGGEKNEKENGGVVEKGGEGAGEEKMDESPAVADPIPEIVPTKTVEDVRGEGVEGGDGDKMAAETCAETA